MIAQFFEWDEDSPWEDQALEMIREKRVVLTIENSESEELWAKLAHLQEVENYVLACKDLKEREHYDPGPAR